MIEYIAEAIYAEARGESLEGQRAVAHVILNRMKDSRWPSTAKAVVRQPRQFVTRRGSGSTWEHCLRVASNPGDDLTEGALFFATYNAWPNKRKHGRIGGHLFFS